MVLLENIKHKIQNLPGYVKAKVKGKPFHWTMTRKQMETRKRAYENYANSKKSKLTSENRRDRICEQLESLGATNMPQYKNTYKKLCISAENANVGEVNLNLLNQNLESESLNLALKENPLQLAKSYMMEASSLLDLINNRIEKLPRTSRPHTERIKEIQEIKPELLRDIEKGKGLAQRAIEKAQPLSEMPNGRQLLGVSKELVGTFNSVAREIQQLSTYTKDLARQNLENGIRSLQKNEYRNLSEAYSALRQSPQNLELISEYGLALDEFQKKRRAARVKSMMKGAYGGRRTRRKRKLRKTRKH